MKSSLRVGLVGLVALAGCYDDDWRFGGGTSAGVGGGPGTGAGEPAGPCLPISISSEAVLEPSGYLGAGVDIAAVAPLPGGDLAVLLAYEASDEPTSFAFAGVPFGLPTEPDGSSGGLVVRVRPDATMVWMKLIKGLGSSNDLFEISADGSGNIYVAGHFRGDALTVDGAVVERRTSQGTKAIFAAKLRGADGGVFWARSYGEYGDDVVALHDIAVSSSGELALSLDYESRFHFGDADYAGIGSAVIGGLTASGEPDWSIDLPLHEHVARSLFALPGGDLRALGDYEHGFSVDGFELAEDDGFTKRSYWIQLAGGAAVAAGPVAVETEAKLTEQKAITQSAHYVLTTTSDSQDTDLPLLARADGASPPKRLSSSRRAIDLVEDGKARALILGHGNDCATDFGPVISRHESDGTETGLVPIYRAGYTPHQLVVTDAGDMILVYGDMIQRTPAMPEAP